MQQPTASTGSSRRKSLQTTVSLERAEFEGDVTVAAGSDVIDDQRYTSEPVLRRISNESTGSYLSPYDNAPIQDEARRTSEGRTPQKTLTKQTRLQSISE